MRKGAADRHRRWVEERGGTVPDALDGVVEKIAVFGEAAGGPSDTKVLGVIHLKDVVKEGMAERFAQLRAMGIRTVMITGDNPLTARAIGRGGRR